MTPSLRRLPGALGVALALAWTAPGAAQELADYDYENLGFRGIGLFGGYMVPTRVEPTWALGARMDLGYLGPGLRLTPTVSYWSSTLKRSEVGELEERIDTLVARQSPGTPVSVDLGTIDWSDITLGLDAHVVWQVPYDVLTFAGLGATVHLMNGSGDAISDILIEDLLDTVTAGFNVHAGLEYPVIERFRVFGQARYELLEDLSFFEIRLGGQIMIVPTGERAR